VEDVSPQKDGLGGEENKIRRKDGETNLAKRRTDGKDPIIFPISCI
jgi:hypothetical protein